MKTLPALCDIEEAARITGYCVRHCRRMLEERGIKPYNFREDQGPGSKMFKWWRADLEKLPKRSAAAVPRKRKQ